MKTIPAATLLLAAPLVAGVPAREPLPEVQAQGRAVAAEARRPVDLVICLDTSGSMEQLIDSVRGRIWDIVTELSFLQPTPHLRVGLLTYGTPSTSTAEGRSGLSEEGASGSWRATATTISGTLRPANARLPVTSS